jgi:hypothetical protein
MREYEHGVADLDSIAGIERVTAPASARPFTNVLFELPRSSIA